VIARSNDDAKYAARPYSGTVVNKVINEGKAVMMSNTMREDKDDRSESMEIMKIKSVMCVPLISKSKIRGAIYVDSVSKPLWFPQGGPFPVVGAEQPGSHRNRERDDLFQSR